MAKQYGFDPNLIQGGGPDQQSQQIDLQRRAGEASGDTPYGVYDPLFANVGHYGYSKEQQLTPEQYQQRMSLQYGPNWRSGQGGAPLLTDITLILTQMLHRGYNETHGCTQWSTYG